MTLRQKLFKHGDENVQTFFHKLCFAIWEHKE